LTRREWLTIAASAGVAGWAGFRFPTDGSEDENALRDAAAGSKSPVAIVKAASYSGELATRILEGVRACGLDVKGKRIVLKPNMVEFEKTTSINTDVSVIAAALEVFHQLGAAEVRIAEGPGHRRDTYSLAEEAGYRGGLAKFDNLFVDLNRDDVSRVEKFADEGEIYLPNTALGADLIVSIPKMKTHHWAGATLSMKNFFGLVPGSVYGWPKNMLHHVGIPRSIVELNRIFRKTFAIVDGITGMEGNGPIQGVPKHAGVLVMGADLRAVDATCCRIMGIDPAKVEYLQKASALGNASEAAIDQRGEKIGSVRTNFQLIHDFEHLRLG
jgi:uncharacterized protein (DUF362 family)